MKRILSVSALVLAFGGVAVPAAQAVPTPKVPTTICGIATLVGVDYVKDCASGTS
ncbi:MAG: hypothetical protein JWO12_2348 [Frankiales bacterium]|nr:hypothetical protein [Frankiales bacterium]